MFLSPSYLWLLIGVVALAAIYAVLQLRRTRYVARFSNVELLGSFAPKRPGWRRHLTFALLLLALLTLSLGVARPSAAVRVPREKATVMLDIDVSRSMQATDVSPSRIVAARNAAVQFADKLPSRVNLGVESFAQSANVLVPPTLDRDAVRRGLQALKLASYTAIGEAIFASLQAIQIFNQDATAKGDHPPVARIVLLSDGSNTYGRSVASAVKAAKAARIQISTIAFGSPNGTVTINGIVQPVPADTATLRAIALSTGGTFHTAASEEKLKSVYSNIGSQIGYTTSHRDISWRFMLTGLLLLFAAGAAAMLWSGRLV